MLGVSDASKLTKLWADTTLQTVLPVSPVEFFALTGPMLTRRDCERAYERQYLRRKAVVKQDGESLGVYLQDCSRMGIGLLSPIQFFPCERIQVCMDNRRIYELEIRRCQRLGNRCYECGTIFILDSQPQTS